MGNKKLKIKGSIGGSQASKMTTTSPISHLESRVRFSFRNCDIDKFCIRNLSDKEINRFYSRLGYYEQLNWQQLRQLPRDNGFSVEKKDSENHSILSTQFDCFNTFAHFRVYGTENTFRVFGAQNEDLFYILWIDKEGVVNNH